MARKRFISPEFFLHGDLFDAEQASGFPLRLAYIGLWTHADRRGIFAWKPRELKLHILPHDAVDMSSTMSALCQHGFVEYFEVEGKGYGRIPNFAKWQTFHVNEKPDLRLPEPLSDAPARFVPPQHGTSTVLAPYQHGASTPVTTTTAVTTEQHARTVADAPAAPPPALSVVRAERPAREKKPPAYPHFPMPLCRDLHALWVSSFGASDFARFRKAFGPLFTIAEADRPADAPSNAELSAALKSYVDLAPMGPAARFANVNHAAGCLAAIAKTRRDYADAPDKRSDAVMRIIHGRASA